MGRADCGDRLCPGEIMRQKEKGIASKKGLVRRTIKSEPGLSGFRLVQIGPNSWTQVRDLVPLIRENLEKERAFALEYFRSKGIDPATYKVMLETAEILDRDAAAAEILDAADRVDLALRKIEAAEDGPLRSAALEAIFGGQALSSAVETWGIVDHETAIVAHADSKEGARKGGRARARSTEARDKKMALRFLELRKPASVRASATSLKVKVGKEFGLKASAAKAAVDRGLTRLQQNGRRAGQTDQT